MSSAHHPPPQPPLLLPRFLREADGVYCVCLSDDMAGIFVRSIAEGSAADLDGRVQINDQIIEVRKATSQETNTIDKLNPFTAS